MKVLVLGGTGFIGSHVARAFLRAGHEVAVGVRPKSSRELLTGLELEFVPADLQEPETLVRAARGRDVVVHAAGLLSLWERDREPLYRANVIGTRNVVQACLKAGAGRLIYDGSVGVYAGSSSPIPVDEEGADDAERFHSFHVTSMCLGEAEVYKGIVAGLDAVLLHPSLCLGAGDRNFHSSWAIACLSYVGLSFTPPGGLNVVDVEDVAHAHVLAAERAPRGGSYLLGGENLTNAAFLATLREVLGVGGLSLPMSRAGIRGLGSLFEQVARLTGENRGAYVTLNEALSQSMSLYWFVDDSRARRELGYGPSPIRPALERQVAWMRERGDLPPGFQPAAFLRRFLRAPRG